MSTSIIQFIRKLNLNEIIKKDNNEWKDYYLKE